MKNRRVKDVTKKDIRKVQKVIIIIFVLIIALDFIFVLERKGNFPTISKVIHEAAAQKYFVITWIWGVLTPQLFIVRKPTFLSISLLNRAVIVLALTSVLLTLGQLIEVKNVHDMVIGQGVQAALFLSGAITSYFLWPNYSLD